MKVVRQHQVILIIAMLVTSQAKANSSSNLNRLVNGLSETHPVLAAMTLCPPLLFAWIILGTGIGLTTGGLALLDNPPPPGFVPALKNETTYCGVGNSTCRDLCYSPALVSNGSQICADYVSRLATGISLTTVGIILDVFAGINVVAGAFITTTVILRQLRKLRVSQTQVVVPFTPADPPQPGN